MCGKVEEQMDQGVKGLWMAVKTMDADTCAPVITTFYNGQVLPLIEAQTTADKLKKDKQRATTAKVCALRKELTEEYKALVEKDQTPKSIPDVVGSGAGADEEGG